MQMAQLTIYLDEDLIQRVREAAQEAGIPQSQWIAKLIRERTRTSWPESVRKLAGSWKDFPSLEELRETEGTDTQRESL